MISYKIILPDEDEGDEEEVVESKSAARGLFDKAKAAVVSKRDAAKYKAAVGKLREIEQRRQQLLALDQAESQVASELLKECEASVPYSAIKKDGSLEEFKESYRAYLVAEMETGWKVKWLREKIGGMMRVSTINRGQGGDIAVLVAEFPSLKQTLADAVCGKAAQAKVEADRVERDEQKRLDSEYGAGEYEAEDSTPVKRARANVEYVNAMVTRFQSEPVESLYLDVVRYLLQ